MRTEPESGRLGWGCGHGVVVFSAYKLPVVRDAVARGRDILDFLGGASEKNKSATGNLVCRH